MKNNHFLRMILVSVAALLLTACEGELTRDQQDRVMDMVVSKNYALKYLCSSTSNCDSQAKSEMTSKLDGGFSINMENQRSANGEAETITIRAGGEKYSCIDCKWDVRLVGDVFLFTFKDIEIESHVHLEKKVKHNLQLFFPPTGQKCTKNSCERSEYSDAEYYGRLNFHFRVYHNDGSHSHDDLNLRHDTTHGGGTDT